MRCLRNVGEVVLLRRYDFKAILRWLLEEIDALERDD